MYMHVYITIYDSKKKSLTMTIEVWYIVHLGLWWKSYSSKSIEVNVTQKKNNWIQSLQTGCSAQSHCGQPRRSVGPFQCFQIWSPFFSAFHSFFSPSVSLSIFLVVSQRNSFSSLIRYEYECYIRSKLFVTLVKLRITSKNYELRQESEEKRLAHWRK